jgi:hypothetical protein
MTGNEFDVRFDGLEHGWLEKKRPQEPRENAVSIWRNQKSALLRANGRVFRADVLELVSIFLAVEAAQRIRAQYGYVGRFG